jgi:hypothetical protein
MSTAKHLGPFVLIFVFGVGCASSPGHQVGTSVLMVPMPGNGQIMQEYPAVAVTVPLAPDSLYEIIKRAYQILEIPITQQSPIDRSVGNDALKVRRKLGGLNMQQVLDCGEKLGMPNAETWDIWLSIFSTAVPDANGGSVVSTRIQAMGHETSRSNQDWVLCATKAELEEKIGNLVKSMAEKN